MVLLAAVGEHVLVGQLAIVEVFAVGVADELHIGRVDAGRIHDVPERGWLRDFVGGACNSGCQPGTERYVGEDRLRPCRGDGTRVVDDDEGPV